MSLDAFFAVSLLRCWTTFFLPLPPSNDRIVFFFLIPLQRPTSYKIGSLWTTVIFLSFYCTCLSGASTAHLAATHPLLLALIWWSNWSFFNHSPDWTRHTFSVKRDEVIIIITKILFTKTASNLSLCFLFYCKTTHFICFAITVNVTNYYPPPFLTTFLLSSTTMSIIWVSPSSVPLSQSLLLLLQLLLTSLSVGASTAVHISAICKFVFWNAIQPK